MRDDSEEEDEQANTRMVNARSQSGTIKTGEDG